MLSLLFPYYLIHLKPSVMKKKLVVLSLLCLSVACAPDSLNQTEQETSGKTLRATLMSGDETRTEFGESTSTGSHSQINWSAGDQIKVFSAGAPSQYVTADGGKTAVFSLVEGSDAPSGSSLLGLYPFAEAADADVSASSITTVIPDEQQAVAGAFDPAALIAVGSSSSTDKMAFYNVCSGLRFTLSGSNASKYTRIELTGNNSEKIAGAIDISCSRASAPEASPASSGSKTKVSLVLPEGGSFKKGGTYYLVFRPGIFTKGFTMKFISADGTITSKCNSYVEFKRGVFASIKGADNPDVLAAIRDGELLSKDGTANCYIVSKAGSYKFPLSRATEEEFLSGVNTVEVLWETDNTYGTQTQESIIKNVVTNKKFVYFDTPATLKNGNAVIVAKNLSGSIVWSWHIWVCKDYNPSSSSQLYTGKNAAMMDRNLGALSAAEDNALTNGLFYQWGRKDPFPGAVEAYAAKENGGHLMKTTAGSDLKVASSEDVEATVDYATEHPDTYITTTKNNGDWLAKPNDTLWGQTKTIYDPCPAGWRVPAAYVLNSSNVHVGAKEAWSELTYKREASGIYGVYLDGRKAWYPNNGYISLAGKLLMVGQYSCYWSCSLNSRATYAMEMSQTSSSSLTFKEYQYGKVRGEGHSVRCVQDK